MTTRALPVVVILLFLSVLLSPTEISAQTPDPGRPKLDRFTFQVGAGPLLKSGGHNVSAGFGFSPISRLDFLVSVERHHLPFTRDTFRDVYSITRGGTLTAVSGELRASVLPPHRISPYAFAGIGRGVSRPTVNDAFPIPVENDLRVVYFGGGVRVPLRGGLTVFGDARLMLALEGDDGFTGVWPVRAGLSWRF
jgi:hypothetical protein